MNESESESESEAEAGTDQESASGASDRAGRGGKRRVGVGRVAQVLGLALLAVGIALLALPYDTTLAVDSPAGAIIDLTRLPDEARCEAPILDAFHDQPDVWINYSPESGTNIESERLSGSWCMPESLQRGGGGVLLIVLGLSTIALGTLGNRSGRRRAVSPEPA